MKIFNGRLATEDYMSTHSLTFSTPEMTLKKFAIWLGEQIKNSKTNTSTPRLFLYLEDKSDSKTESSTTSSYLPDIDETFRPSGAIADIYATKKDDNDPTITKTSTNSTEKKYCINCGGIIKYSSKFCNKCGYVQE